MKTYNTIFVDFDETLCLHKQVIVYADDNPFKEKVSIFKDSLLNSELAKYLYNQKEAGAKIILLSTCNSVWLKKKREWVEAYCPDLFDDFISSSVEMNKAQIVAAYMKVNNLDYDEVVMIDDYFQVLFDFRENKTCAAYLPSYIVENRLLENKEFLD